MSEKPTLLSPNELAPASELTARILEQMDRILLGRAELHRLVLAGILSQGHILLEGLPGLGKTALVRTIGQIMKLDFKRIQFTPDLMPSDVLGAHILQENPSGVREMTFHPGPVFTHILLADEINRASPKTQSALLETMQERTVTLLGTTRRLPHPFFVLASQNPIELEGTYPLPEAQLDRFLFRLIFNSVDQEVLDAIISGRRRGELPAPTWQMETRDLETLFGAMERIFLPRPVSKYIARLVAASHSEGAEAPELVKRYVTYGASPRAAIAIAEAARARALIQGRPTVGFEDVKDVVHPVLNHRLILNFQARFDHVDTTQVIQSLVSTLSETGIRLPDDVKLGN
ncbi:MAG TPA: AAA family ATPase [Candidatus Paceibacterota bacterium]|nr:AAA family ATPase [Verrucomicrobiota bacterium]HRY49934.1 AAA family ATPase [Candidatus Paceibacterota bacterium]HSA00195.1 AAA family ATPase [Candidatus Paceibacterota bacterium]